MAHFYGSLKGDRKQITKCGTKYSRIEANIKGWDLGVRSLVEYDISTNSDYVLVYKTKGSNGSSEELIFDSRKDLK